MIDEPEQVTKSGIVYVDDTPAMVEVILAMLEQLGYPAVGFTDPEEALAALTDGSVKPALVLADRSMPKLDGFRLFRAIQALDPDLPFVLLTGLLDESVVPQYLEAGITAVVGKPIGLVELNDCIKGIVGPPE